MLTNLKRLGLAACISATGVVGTLIWERLAAENSNETVSGTPIAELKVAVRGVTRKPSQRLIWEPISEGSQLFVGETIRTASDAEASVEFVKSKTRIDLDPDSEIILEEVDGKLELNFLKGNLFVASASSGSDITLKAGDKNIALDGSEVSLTQDQKGKVDVTVLKGGSGLASSSAQIKIVSPQPNDLVYSVAKSGVEIAFEPPPAGYKLILEAGRRRDEMKPLAFTGAPESGKIQAPFKLGRLYWRLTAKPEEAGKPELASAAFRLNILAKTPVVLLKPEKDEVISLADLKAGELPLRWSNPSQLESLQLEVFKGRDFKNPLISETLEEGSVGHLARLTEPGDYNWRVSGRLKGKTEVVVGSLRPFRAVARKDLAIPIVISPRMDDVIPFQTFSERGLDLKWKPVEGAVSYKVTIVNKKSGSSEDREASSPLLRVDNLKAGDYSWSVRAIGPGDEVSKPSAVSTFGLQELMVFAWADGKTEADHRYFTSEPSVDLAWENGPASAVKWRVRLTAEREIASDGAWSLVGTTNMFKGLPHDGTYLAEVEALDAQARVIARAPKRRIAVAAQPLLEAPKFSAALGDEITAANNGSVEVTWDSVPGAAEYIVKYEGRSSSEVRVKETSSVLKRLMPGRYVLTLRSVDPSGRAGPASAPKAVIVPNKSDVKAPKLRRFEVQ